MELGEDDAYGLAIYERAKAFANGRIAYGSLYPTLDRLEKSGLISSKSIQSGRSGRARRFFKVEGAGEMAYKATARLIRELPRVRKWAWDGGA